MFRTAAMPSELPLQSIKPNRLASHLIELLCRQQHLSIAPEQTVPG